MKLCAPMLELGLDPVLLKIGIFEVRYYGLVFVFGFIAKPILIF